MFIKKISKKKLKYRSYTCTLYAFDLLYHLESVPETTESLWDYKITKLSRLWPLIKLVYFLGKINFMFQQPILEELAKFLPTINGFTFHLSKKKTKPTWFTLKTNISMKVTDESRTIVIYLTLLVVGSKIYVKRPGGLFATTPF